MAREESFFDDLARGLADGSITRGKALRLMGAAVVGGTLGSLGVGEASAAPIGCKRNGKNCTRSDQCCSGNCSSGSCRAQTTTTTTTPTTTTSTTTSTSTTSTSTTTPITSTSTSTTSTTPGCVPNESPCTSNGQCCSNICGFFEPGSDTLCDSCRAPGGSCAAGELCCGTFGTCMDGRCCISGELDCNETTPCCSGICVNGSCER
jgi:hypothetical protein